MNTNKAPIWEWEGSYDCEVCDEPFFFSREEGWPQLEGWKLQVWHDHTGEEPIWRAAAYRTWKGRRKPDIVKNAAAQKKEAYKREIERRQISNASVD